jgi:hypothetical protein
VVAHESWRLQSQRRFNQAAAWFFASIGVNKGVNIFLWRPLLNDPMEDMLLELAVAARCQSIVT